MYDCNGASADKRERRTVLSARRSSSLLAGMEDQLDITTFNDAEAWGQSLIAAVNAWEAKRRGWGRG
jgi:hypothetical protein